MRLRQLASIATVFILPFQGQAQTYAEFQALFQDSAFGRLHVYSHQEFLTPQDSVFEGREIPGSLLTFIGREPDSSGNKFHAVIRFPFGKKLEGFLVRQPIRYHSTLISLYIFHSKKRRLVASIDLADGWGEVGWSFLQDSWLMDYDQNGSLDIITRTTHLQRRRGSPSRKTIVDEMSVFIWAGNGFRRIQHVRNRPFHSNYRLRWTGKTH